MLYKNFEKDLPYLDRYHNNNFEPGSGISDYDEIQATLHKMREEMDNIPHQVSFAKMIAFVFEKAAIEVNPKDFFGVNIAGWLPDRARYPFRVMQGIVLAWKKEALANSEEGRAINELSKDLMAAGAAWCYPDTDHSKPNWEDIIALGIPGLLNRLKAYRDSKIEKGEYTEDQKNFYESSIIVYESLIVLINRFAECTKKHINDSEKMPLLYDALVSISKQAPQTLYEVMLLTFIYSLTQEYVTGVQTRTLGNIDTLWRPYYEKALADGSLTRDDVKQLLKYFYMQYEMAGHPHSQPVHLGGNDKYGNSRVNDLSFLILEAYEELNIISPKLQVAVSQQTPNEFLRKCCDMIRAGHSSLVFGNEEVGRAGQRIFTDNEEDMAELSLSGCYNFSLKENIQPESVGTSFVKGIELALNNGYDPTTGKTLGLPTGDADSYKDFDAFYDAYMKQTYHLIDAVMRISDFYDNNMLEISPSPMLSANFEYAVAAGKDVYYNGAKYHNSCITISCIATATDSLYAIKKYVYDNKVITLPELRDALLADWKGYEKLQYTIANDTEKYGNDIDAVDSIAADIMHKVAVYISSKNTPLGVPYAPDGEGITHGITFGKKTGATPDGRNAGEQLSKNLQAVFGCDIRGITAYINSVTKINAVDYPNGAPIDFVLHPTAVEGEAGLDVMVGLIRTTFKKGGSAIQGNVYSAAKLKAAQAEPEKYKGLQVRVCGWSQYFNRLSKDEQDMMIRAAESVG